MRVFVQPFGRQCVFAFLFHEASRWPLLHIDTVHFVKNKKTTGYGWAVTNVYALNRVLVRIYDTTIT